jgi:hypothetical protein
MIDELMDNVNAYKRIIIVVHTKEQFFLSQLPRAGLSAVGKGTEDDSRTKPLDP